MTTTGERELTVGAKKLAEFIGKRDISKRQAAKDLGISAPTLLDWLNGTLVPTAQRRPGISVYTHGEIAEEDWITEREREVNETVAAVRPYEPPPHPEKRPESGEHQAVDAPASTGSDDE